MEVINTSRRGPQTLYTVKEGERVWVVERSELPDAVFKRWRQYQAAECMRKKRARERGEQVATSSRDEDEAGPSRQEPDGREEVDEARPDHQPEQPVQQNQAIEQMRQLDRAAYQALSKLTCKVCKFSEVKHVLWPCGHLVVCPDCLRGIMATNQVCPLCRTEITDHLCIFLVE